MTLETDDQPDAIDAEHIRQVVATRGFQLIAERVQALRDGSVQRLLSADLIEVPRLQAAIRAYDIVLGLPRRIVEEISGAARQ